MLKYAVAMTCAGLIGLGLAPAQDRACLHGPAETPAESLRRQAALRFVREVNTTENAAHNLGQTYYTLGDLHTLPAPPEGFKAQLSTDGASYTFSVKDTLDACRFAYFSDQEGMIYNATPIR